MKSYTIYVKENGDPIKDAVYLSEGFSFAALVFNITWLLYQRLWLHTILFTVMSIGIIELNQAYIIDSFVTFIAFFALWFYIGFNGKDYLRQRLEMDGYKLSDIVIANSEEEAEFRYISRHFEVQK
jgi:hypothetical protein